MIKTLYEKFQPWSDGGSIWLISDTHFDDHDCQLMDRGWPLPEEHVALINQYVTKSDTLIHLGDVGDPHYIDKLKARYKILITGNHDAGASRYRECFDEIYTGPLVIADKIILSHEPLYVMWAVNIHGHNHNRSDIGDLYHLNLAANVVDYLPVNLGRLIKDGLLSGIDSIHRQTIDDAIDKRLTTCYN